MAISGVTKKWRLYKFGTKMLWNYCQIWTVYFAIQILNNQSLVWFIYFASQVYRFLIFTGRV